MYYLSDIWYRRRHVLPVWYMIQGDECITCLIYDTGQGDACITFLINDIEWCMYYLCDIWYRRVHVLPVWYMIQDRMKHVLPFWYMIQSNECITCLIYGTGGWMYYLSDIWYGRRHVLPVWYMIQSDACITCLIYDTGQGNACITCLIYDTEWCMYYLSNIWYMVMNVLPVWYMIQDGVMHVQGE